MKEPSIALSSKRSLPEHVAVIMDGNGRWAQQRKIPRFMGHKEGLETLQKLVSYCLELEIRYLTVFAFSTENWQRPRKEVEFLMKLFSTSLKKKIKDLHARHIRFRCIGRSDRLREELLMQIEKGQKLTENNKGLTLTVAVDYGGRWDITHAVNRLIQKGYSEVTEALIRSHLALADIPEPELFIRTGGELRISNFFLWQLAYTEFYFTDTLWPDFGKEHFLIALRDYQSRERRFGCTSEQLSLNQVNKA